MFRKIAPLFLALLLLSPAPIAVAADADGRFAVRGVGARLCQDLTKHAGSENEAVRRENMLAFRSWLDGYISHVNRSVQDTFDALPILDAQATLALLLAQCRRQPQALVESVANAIVTELAPHRIEAESQVVVLSSSGREVRYRVAAIVRMQQKLIDKGFLNGTADGQYGRDTRDAMRRFQAGEKLPETGQPDINTVLRLLLR